MVMPDPAWGKTCYGQSFQRKRTCAVNYSSDGQLAGHLTLLRCFFLLGKHHRVEVTPDIIAKVDVAEPVTSVMGLMREVGLVGKLLRERSWNDLAAMSGVYPALAERKSGDWIVVVSVRSFPDGRGLVGVLDPRQEAAGGAWMEREEFEQEWSGRLLLCRRKKFRPTDESQPFGFLWFMPEILRNGRYFRDIAIAAVMSTFLGVGTPLLFNILIDKVVPHQSYQTLFAVVLAFMMATLFDSVFTYVRQYLMLFAGNKIDARLASRTFDHMLGLPMQFFESTSAGVLLRNIQQTEAVRGFITGRLFQTLLDVFAFPVYLVTLVLYSGTLTLVVLAITGLIAAIIGVMIPIFRKQLEELYMAEGARQADLVETIVGMRAVKSLALEPARRVSWDEKVAQSVRRRGTVGHTSIIAVVVTNGLSSILQLAILGIGAVMVFDGNMSLGALVAFNMLAGRVIGPLLQIVSLVNDYQQTAVSVKMLGTVMDHPPERDPNQKGIRPPVTGELEFSGVSFRYEGSVTPALNHVSFRVEEGQMIGVVGRSGSGKTTLTRLIQGIHTAQEGLIQLNGTDIRHMDLGHLRRSIGVVLQDNILFRGTIRDNIAAAKPDATLEEVMEVARLAGADEFIDRLPRSYETLVEESASNFSGGQRQRIAIARALLLRPRVLLFDEATSALDPESEAIVQQNLGEIARGRTMIVVSHRLSSLANADRILVLDKGAVADYAPHETLLERCDIYRHLWDQQTRFMQ